MGSGPLEQLARLLLTAGLALIAVGAVVWLLGRLGAGGLPGDIVIRRGGLTVYLPLATGLLLSIVLTVLLNLLLRR